MSEASYQTWLAQVHAEIMARINGSTLITARKLTIRYDTACRDNWPTGIPPAHMAASLIIAHTGKDTACLSEYQAAVDLGRWVARCSEIASELGVPLAEFADFRHVCVKARDRGLSAAQCAGAIAREYLIRRVSQ